MQIVENVETLLKRRLNDTCVRISRAFSAALYEHGYVDRRAPTPSLLFRTGMDRRMTTDLCRGYRPVATDGGCSKEADATLCFLQPAYITS
jgi:hypothetical protein